MIWVILALLGVPLWLCAFGIAVLVFRYRGLTGRYGDIPVRVRRPGKKRWTRGHAVWALRCLRVARQPRRVERGPGTGRRCVAAGPRP